MCLKYHGCVDFETFDEISWERKVKSLIDCKALIINPDEHAFNNRMIYAKDEPHKGLNFFEVIRYDGKAYTLNQEVRDEMWLEYYSSHQLHPFENKKINEIDSKINRLSTTEKLRDYISSQMDDLDIFHLDNLQVELDHFTKSIYFQGEDGFITESFSNKRIYHFLTGMLGRGYTTCSEIELRYSEDIAKFRVYKYLESLYNDLNSTSDEISKFNDSTFSRVHILDKTGYFQHLEEKGYTKEETYKIVGEIIGRSPKTVKTQKLRLAKPSKLLKTAKGTLKKLNDKYNL